MKKTIYFYLAFYMAALVRIYLTVPAFFIYWLFKIVTARLTRRIDEGIGDFIIGSDPIELIDLDTQKGAKIFLDL